MTALGRSILALACFVSLGTCLSACNRQKPTTSAGHELLPSGAPALLIDVPPEYTVEARKGADFDVFYIQRAKTEHGDPPKDGMGIYVGHAPNFSPPQDARTMSGTIAGRKIAWYAWEDERSDRTLLRMETLITGLFTSEKEKAGGAAGDQVHIFLWAPGDKRLGILKDAAETLRLK
jgi:hypothetical protein